MPEADEMVGASLDRVGVGFSDQSDSLPTSVIERYLSRTGHGTGMVFAFSVRFTGSIDHGKLQDAWQLTAQQNPRIYYRLSGSGSQQTWQKTAFDPSLFLVEQTEVEDLLTYVPSVDVRAGAGAKLVLHEDQVGSRVLFLFHHAACDGVGAARIAYNTFKNFSGIRNRPVRSQSPRTSDPGESAPQEASTKPGGLPAVSNLWPTVRGRNVRLRKHQKPLCSIHHSGDITSDAASVSEISKDTFKLTLSSEITSRARDRLQTLAIPINDLGVALTARAIAAVTQGSPRRYINVMNPVQTRTWQQRRSTENHIGFAYIRRRHDELEDFGDSLSNIAEQLRYVREHGISHELAIGLSIAEKLPGCVGLIEKTGLFVPTASLTCMSSIKIGKRSGANPASASDRNTTTNSYIVGDATVEDLEIVGPIQRGGQLSITIWDSGIGITASFRHAMIKNSHNLVERIASQWATDFTNFAQQSF